jgi:hypothetical protein
MDAIKASVGATKERTQHSKIVPYDAEIAPGGTIIAAGQRDLEHCYLDFLLNNHLLGNREDSIVRYDTGYKLRSLYFRFKTTGNDYNARGASLFTSDAQIGDDTDIAETFYNITIRALPEKYRHVVRSVCLADLKLEKGAPDYHMLIVDGLDALFGAFDRAQKRIDEIVAEITLQY